VEGILMFHASRGNACRHALRVAKQSGKRSTWAAAHRSVPVGAGASLWATCEVRAWDL